MAADNTVVRKLFVTRLQAAAKAVTLLSAQIDILDSLYQGDSLSGTFVDAELAAYDSTKHLIATDIATFKGNLTTIRTAITTNILQGMAKCLGDIPT